MSSGIVQSLRDLNRFLHKVNNIVQQLSWNPGTSHEDFNGEKAFLILKCPQASLDSIDKPSIEQIPVEIISRNRFRREILAHISIDVRYIAFSGRSIEPRSDRECSSQEKQLNNAYECLRHCGTDSLGRTPTGKKSSPCHTLDILIAVIKTSLDLLGGK
jgi:hypothetical protein